MKLRVFEKGFAFDYVEENVFEGKITVFAINESKEKFIAKIEKLLACQSRGEMSEICCIFWQRQLLILMRRFISQHKKIAPVLRLGRVFCFENRV
ncbi:TPA: hypothetical protein ACQQBA_001395 [Streptococcus mutans]|uniref:hypothetical protein n=1 Tax=Streptococcus mutans TaxID=1309 RepID=UPI0002B5A5D7|nr:hypothetical protein [Streptococcus mutans]EMC07249.1 hypothetical protein SMU72_08663 [Streptococcus mutans NLML9]MCB5088694.1 hypothetical protein [Streptococcus mutans]